MLAEGHWPSFDYSVVLHQYATTTITISFRDLPGIFPAGGRCRHFRGRLLDDLLDLLRAGARRRSDGGRGGSRG